MEYEKQFASPLTNTIQINTFKSPTLLAGNYLKNGYEQSMKNSHLKTSKINHKEWNVA
jgi:hypothetical protein